MERKPYQRIAASVMVYFAEYRLNFQEMTEQARVCFESGDWGAIQDLSAQRIDLYEAMVAAAVTEMEHLLGEELYLSRLWNKAKPYYRRLLQQRTDPELAETFYNSVYCRVFRHGQIDDEHMFIFSSWRDRLINTGGGIYQTYPLAEEGGVRVLFRLLQDLPFQAPWESLRRDIRNILLRARTILPLAQLSERGAVVQVIRSLFYRNKAAYVVGRVHLGEKSVPFVLPVLNNGQGKLYVDTLICDENDVSIIFSFTRSYFLVDVDVPSEFVRFLHTLIPAKSIPELYSSIGFYKQGKAEFFRNFVSHLEQSQDQFIIAPGVKGMVMTVFTLPSYPVVFKVIKDHFSSSKQITREGVKEKYQLVKRHDRVGRMADTQEFTNFSFPLERFSTELINELEAVAGSSLRVEGDRLIIRHLWTERYMTPLNIFIDDALERQDATALFHAINEYGKAIKQLAAANIFAGDMLFKNFGVTRHGRVVFYDYDEILYLTDCHFRAIPEPLYPEQELSSEPWYSVGPNDVFPEEFSLLTACDPSVRKIFNELHGDLLTVGFWQGMQSQVRQGVLVDVFPYRQLNRFPRND
ncbi:bifunctional isocitrate dehydrogenase kinase/phosphatase [Neptuniibacter sp. CAU 1671]|uniref:bifunctional isocitrate dehydrogenase kinase/phosphatase n=1 Tax=Neptuniibacter sp. CAU 1671 TaxID=3032593 RepID=UPI0023DACC3E|nr:bifunctional isocitrate dehydrogenase kinase/phosphatase [Neptuniibacter sp. CAU 1671]MDF2183082.1 bifunctional isocitrate dehydrogenase kinase/phosphatase [Neptuniibacter sp. CAU 1671]